MNVRRFILLACLPLSAAFLHAQDQQTEEAADSSAYTEQMPEDYVSPPPPPPEGQEIRRYAVDDPGPKATNFGMAPVHDNMLFYFVRGDRTEYRDHERGEAWLWDVQAWVARDYNKLYVESEGEYSLSEDAVEAAQVELFYGRAVTSFWDFRAGLRYDFEPNPERAHLAVGFQGMAQYWLEVDANLYLSEEGDLTFGMEAEYDLLLTQRLILQPRIELDASVSDIPELGIGAGITGIELGIRLRYEFHRKLAPYIGVSWESALGETRNLVEDGGGDPDNTAVVAGLKWWF